MPQTKIEIKRIRSLYKILKPGIKKRIGEFTGVWKAKDDKKLFSEFCFCLLTPQSRAVTCWDAVVGLKKKKILLKGALGPIKKCLEKVRFKNNKAGYIRKAQKSFPKIKKEIRDHKNAVELRDWLVKNVCGMGYKEASHFLRNIGLGCDIAILDRHILKNLKLFGVIGAIPSSMSGRKYFEIEEKMKGFSKENKIPLSHLDLLMWAKETGGIFK